MKRRQVRAKGVRIWDGQSLFLLQLYVKNKLMHFLLQLFSREFRVQFQKKVPEEHLRNNILWSDGTKIEHSGHHLCLEETRNHPSPARFHPYSEVATK